ncbi:hypothetical protein EKK58_07175 [Candidatus Dependentiae bacterium]|nr:MAG: hypothetical protein EKK58_07175 [Candidatus Dependentiae bacterium]
MVNYNKINTFQFIVCLLLAIPYISASQKSAIYNNYTIDEIKKSYNDIKEWGKTKTLFTTINLFQLKNIENHLNWVPTECIRTIVKMLFFNIKKKIDTDENYYQKSAYQFYFVKKYLQNQLEKIPAILTDVKTNVIINEHYPLLQKIYQAYFNFTNKEISPEDINSVEKIIAHNFLQSKKDYYYALLLFASQEDIITNMFIYGELEPTINDSNIDLQLTKLIEKISKNIRYNSTILYNKNGSAKKAEIEKNILEKIPKNILKKLQINNLKNILQTFIEIQKKYNSFATSTKDAIKNIPVLCNNIKEWLGTTTLPPIEQPAKQLTCNETNMQDILYKIRAQLIPKYSEIKQYLPKISAPEKNKDYRHYQSMLDNLELVNQMNPLDETAKMHKNELSNIFDYQETFNFYKNAYTFYESIVTPWYRSWAQENGIPCLQENNLPKIIDNIKEHLSQKTTLLDTYEPLSTKMSQPFFNNQLRHNRSEILKKLNNASTLNELSKIYEEIYKKTTDQEQRLKKIYSSWAYNNTLINSNNTQDKTLEQIITEIKASLKQQFSFLPKQYQDKNLELKIYNAKTLNELSSTYTQVRQLKLQPILLPNNTTMTQKPIVTQVMPSEQLSKKEGWFSWLSSWFYSSTNK